MHVTLLPVTENDFPSYKKDMQEAFQQGAVEEFDSVYTEILPEEDIQRSLNTKGAIAYKALLNGNMIGGAIVVIDEKTQHNHLDFLYVKCRTQSRGFGQLIWKEIERLHSKTKVWETITPYFEKRNIHFYVNCCGFHIVEFIHPHHKDSTTTESPDTPSDMLGDDYLFRFEKKCESESGL